MAKIQHIKARNLIIFISMNGSLAVNNWRGSPHHSSLCKLQTKCRLEVVSTISNEIQNLSSVSHSFLEHNWNNLSLAKNIHKWKTRVSFQWEAAVTQGMHLNAENPNPRTSFKSAFGYSELQSLSSSLTP